MQVLHGPGTTCNSASAESHFPPEAKDAVSIDTHFFVLNTLAEGRSPVSVTKTNPGASAQEKLILAFCCDRQVDAKTSFNTKGGCLQHPAEK